MKTDVVVSIGDTTRRVFVQQDEDLSISGYIYRTGEGKPSASFWWNRAKDKTPPRIVLSNGTVLKYPKDYEAIATARALIQEAVKDWPDVYGQMRLGESRWEYSWVDFQKGDAHKEKHSVVVMATTENEARTAGRLELIAFYQTEKRADRYARDRAVRPLS